MCCSPYRTSLTPLPQMPDICSARRPWPPQAADNFTTACRVHGVSAPQPAPDHDTTFRCYHEATAPRPPEHILQFCCPRIFLADSAHATSDAAWQELPDRHMHWAPTHRCACGATPLCTNTIRCCKPSPSLPSSRHAVLAHSRGWVCCRGSPPQVLPCPDMP